MHNKYYILLIMALFGEANYLNSLNIYLQATG